MPINTNDPHYKYSDKYLRNNPSDAAEEKLAELLAEKEVDRIMAQYEGEGPFLKRLSGKLAPRLLEHLQPSAGRNNDEVL